MYLQLGNKSLQLIFGLVDNLAKLGPIFFRELPNALQNSAKAALLAQQGHSQLLELVDSFSLQSTFEVETPRGARQFIQRPRSVENRPPPSYS